MTSVPPSSNQPVDEGELQAPIESQHQQGPRLGKYFRAMTKLGASDLHIRPGTVPHMRINMVIRPTKGEPLSAAETEAMALELMDEKHKAAFAAIGSVDVAYQQHGGDRYRVNVYRQRGFVSLAVRRVTRIIPNFAELNLPPVLGKISEQLQGLVLVSGATGCGKSTTIAAMLEHINATRACHIVTLEDPIEFLYEDKKALVSQREIGIDVESFETALKYLMREDPDVVLIGELRDRDTFRSALQASETGHLVFGTVHASGAAATLGRVLELFPPDSRDQIRQSLSFNLKTVICQKLLPCITEGIDRIPAVEIMMSSPIIRQLIHEGRDNEISEVIRACEAEGMRTFNKSLYELIEKGLVDPRVAYENAPNADELKMMVKGITTSRAGLIGR